MGVEPTADVSATPATGFEDRDAHRDASAPTTPQYYPETGGLVNLAGFPGR